MLLTKLIIECIKLSNIIRITNSLKYSFIVCFNIHVKDVKPYNDVCYHNECVYVFSNLSTVVL